VRAQLPPEAPEYVDIAAPGLTAEEAAALRTRFLERYPEIAAYYESLRSKSKEPVWTASQKPSKEPK